MTKEELIIELFGLHSFTVGILDYTRVIDKFFELNVCIPKGKILQVEINGKWQDTLITNKDFAYRIKSPEPIYEWQWYSVIDWCVDDTTDTWESKQWLTEKEMIAWGNHWHKFEETKRIRQ